MHFSILKKSAGYFHTVKQINKPTSKLTELKIYQLSLIC